MNVFGQACFHTWSFSPSPIHEATSHTPSVSVHSSFPVWSFMVLTYPCTSILLRMRQADFLCYWFTWSLLRFDKASFLCYFAYATCIFVRMVGTLRSLAFRQPAYMVVLRVCRLTFVMSPSYLVHAKLPLFGFIITRYNYGFDQPPFMSPPRICKVLTSGLQFHLEYTKN